MSDPIKWYVNLPQDPEKHEGSVVRIVAAASDLGKKARVVDWKLVAEGTNTKKKYLSAKQRAIVLPKSSVNLEDKFRTLLFVPHVGGDKYKVEVKKRGGGGSTLETPTIETWRKIFVAVHYMDAKALQTFNSLRGTVEGVFKKVFVELAWEPAATKTLVEEPWTSATPTHMPHLYDTARTKLDHRPFHMRLLLVTEIYEKKNLKYGPLELRKAQCTAAGAHRYRFENPIGWTSADTGCRKAKVSLGAGTPWRDITDLATKAGDNVLSIEIKKDPQAWRQLEAGQPVWLYIETNEREHGFNGYSLNNFAVIKTNRPEGAAGCAQTFVHEVGHSLRQVVLWEAEHDDAGRRNGWVKNPLWHENAQGGQGPHCSHNATLAPSTKTKSHKVYVWAGNPLCVMFFCSDEHRQGEYCESCLPKLKRTDLGKEAMSGAAVKNWPPYPPMNWTTYS